MRKAKILNQNRLYRELISTGFLECCKMEFEPYIKIKIKKTKIFQIKCCKEINKNLIVESDSKCLRESVHI